MDAFRSGINPRTRQSRDWFRKRVKNLRSNRLNRDSLMRESEGRLVNKPTVGKMYMFYYDPKHKETLPFYDRFPLIVVVAPAKGGFYGLNLHYLPPILRAKMLDKLYENTNNKKFDETTRIRADYSLLTRLSGAPYYKACFKHYLGAHVESRFSEIEPTEWEIAAFLPTAIWNKASASEVYKDSRRKLR